VSDENQYGIDVSFMESALLEAELAANEGEVPVGAVIVKDGKIVATAHNKRETEKLATAHAELLAIEDACRALGGWRLCGCTLYVTLEPCPMCAGAIINSRIERVVYGAADLAAGCCKSIINVNSYPFNHSFVACGGVLENECSDILKQFFEKKRKGKETNK